MVIDNEDLPYSFALEYEGPPIRDLPRALPIDVYKIPVAAVLPQSCLSNTGNNKLSVPIVQPILASDVLTNFSKLGITEPIVYNYSTSLVSLADDDDDDEISNHNNEIVTTNYHDSVFVSSGEFSSHDHSYELSDRGGSSGTLGFSDSFENSRDMSGNSVTLRTSNACKESLDFSESIASGLSFEYPSGIEESVCDRRTPVVTFRDKLGLGLELESENENESENEDFLEDDVTRVEARVEHESKGKKTRKGACYRCMKGNRFTEKEACIVCNAKYCTNCVLRAMGSMPEGRKCVTCIGYSIDESKRCNLGKCSRMLKRLLNSLEVTQMMKAEKLCAVNQFPSEYVCVNGKPLSPDELAMLQNCANPLKKLKPGNYWYDRVSGLWGKEGDKPCKFISPHLNIGGPIMPDASNGNTAVFINGREITKVELRMLQLSGVQCAGNPHFWVNEDGSYQEEGQKNTRGYIWGKAGTKLVCAVLSLPFPSKTVHSIEKQVSNVHSQTVPDYFDHDAPRKILLIGCNGAGTSTIFKQAKILYKKIPFTEDERENIKLIIQRNVYDYLCILLEGRERFEDEEASNENGRTQSADGSCSIGNVDADNVKTIYSICPRLKTFSDWLLKTMVAGNMDSVFLVATREYAPLVEELWNHPAIQATYERRNELEALPSVSGYFLEQAVDILSAEYIPSDMDVLYAENVTSSNGLSCVDFSLSVDDNIEPTDQHDSSIRFQLIRMQARGIGENFKWLEMFEDVQIVIFCVSLSDYDQYTTDCDENTMNNMILSRKLFETIVTHPTYDQMDFLVVLNKFDIFEEKLERVPLTSCDWFDDFHPVVSRNSQNKNISSNNINHIPSMGQMASHYVAVKFKRLFSSLTDRKLFVSVVNSLEPDSVDRMLKYTREILKWDEEKHNFSFVEYSMYSTEASSYSP